MRRRYAEPSVCDATRVRPRRTATLAATLLLFLTPVRALGEERFFIEPTTDTQPPTQPGFTAVDMPGSPEEYLVEGVAGLTQRIEIGVDYMNTPIHQLLAVGRLRLLDEKRATPAFAIGFDKSTISSFGMTGRPSPDDVYADATKRIGRLRIMAGAYRFAPGYASATTARNNAGALAAVELDFGSANRGSPGAPTGPPAFNLVADFAGGVNAFGQIGIGFGYHPNEHLNIQPGMSFPSDRRSGPARFQLQLHLN